MKVELLLPRLFAEQMPDGAAIDIQPISQWLPASVKPPSSQYAFQEVVLQALGCEVESKGRLPMASCLFLDTPAEHQACAQPVHLDASHDNARLLPAQCLSLTADESDQLVATLNALWNTDGIFVAAHSPINWQITGQDASSLDCPPASTLAYSSVADALPRSADAASWRQLLTESQMLLHEHPVNISRQQRGLRTVNSIWCYGSAALAKPARAVQLTLISDDQFTQGLAKQLNLECGTLNNIDVAKLIDSSRRDSDHQPDDVLIVDTQMQEAWLGNEYDQFMAARDDIIQRLLKPVSDYQLTATQINYRLDDCNGNFFEPTPVAMGWGAKIKRTLSAWR